MAEPIVDVAVLDDYQDLASEHYKDLPERVRVVNFRDTLNPAEPSEYKKLVARLQPFQVISAMRERTPIRRDLLEQLPNLKLILTQGNRNAGIDLDACRERGITVATTGSAQKSSGKVPGPDATAQHTWALIMGLCRHVARDDKLIKAGQWQGPSLAKGVTGRTLGLCGLGRLGSAVARIGVVAFDTSVICWSSNLTQSKADESAASVGLPAGSFKAVSKAELFKQSDILSVHYVLSDRSRGIVGEEELGLMKEEAVLVNTSRGPLIDEAALLKTAEQGKIWGIALDVFDTEPLPASSRWRHTGWGENGTSNVLLSPHMGYGQANVLNSWHAQNVESLRSWLRGEEIPVRLD